ncbi:WD-40 repeat-containing protein [Reticulomyxa filosa]|uniref:WD-40 repeat-containing protein n=1 Tax=Reticulomyxa filosa TaxID=46433 RepID=X6MFP3_RETFI|nr:WD-40 repeat-containing protein [Reticulomyxa filosa]|eukprot:ETO12471.1 WD-40 repeat-containing protein [Reticulomyxa filosa]
MLQAEGKEKNLNNFSLNDCYNKDWVAASNKQDLKNLQCLLCGQVANNAMELNCDEHDNQEDTLVIGEQCLMKYLKENNDQCPIGKHSTCDYVKGRTARKFVCELKVICPRQFMKYPNQREENEAKEGDTPMEDSCAFKGKINEVKEHLENTCSLKTLECIFKKFGCNESLYGSNFEEHMELQMKRHLDLLLGCISDRTVTLALEFFYEIQLSKLDSENKNIQIEELLKQRQQWEEKEKEMKKSQNNLQQDLLKYRTDIERLKKEEPQLTKLLQEKNEILKQNKKYEDELNELKVIIKESQLEIDQLKKQIQNKNDEINSLEQNIQLKDKQIQQMERDIAVVKKDFNDKEKQYHEPVKSFKENFLASVQESHKFFQKMNDQNKREEQKQTDNQDINVYSSLFAPSSALRSNAFSSFKLLKTLSGHTGSVTSIDYSTFDGDQYLCSGSNDNTVRVWDIETNKQSHVFEGHSNYVHCVKFSPYHYHNNRRHVVCSSSDDKTICFWDIKDKKQLQVFNEHTDAVWSIRFSPFNDGRYLCSGSGDKTIRLWDVETSKSLHTFNGHTGDVLCVDISQLQSNSNKNNNIGGNGYTICSGSYDHTIRIWDIETNKLLITFKGHEEAVNSIKYGSNGLGTIGCANTILSGSSDKSVRLWDIRSGQQTQVFNGHLNYVNVVEYSPFVVNHGNSLILWRNSTAICSGSNDNTIRFWDVRSKKELRVINGNDGAILCLKFVSAKRNEKKNENEKNSDYESKRKQLLDLIINPFLKFVYGLVHVDCCEVIMCL